MVSAKEYEDTFYNGLRRAVSHAVASVLYAHAYGGDLSVCVFDGSQYAYGYQRLLSREQYNVWANSDPYDETPNESWDSALDRLRADCIEGSDAVEGFDLVLDEREGCLFVELTSEDYES